MRGAAIPAIHAALPVLFGAGGAVALKIGGAGAAFVMFAVTARTLDAETFGTLTTWFNGMSFLAVVALCGQETLILRLWPGYRMAGRDGHARALVIFALRNTAMAALILFAATILGAHLIGRQLALPVAAAAGLFLAAQSLLHLSSHASRLAVGMAMAEGYREVSWRLVVAAAALACLVSGHRLEPAVFLALAAAAMAAGIAIQLAAVLGGLARGEPASAQERATWRRRMGGMWLGAILDSGSQYLDVVLVALVLDPASAAGYFAASRIANGFTVIGSGLSNYATARIARLYHDGDRAALARLLARLQGLASVCAAIGLVVVAIIGPHLLALFGDGYVGFAPTLFVLSCGAAASLLAGPAPHLLLLCGLEHLYPALMSAAVISRLLLIAAGGATAGPLGAAVAAALVTLGAAIALNVVCRRRLGLDPSVIALVRRPHPSGDLP